MRVQANRALYSHVASGAANMLALGVHESVVRINAVKCGLHQCCRLLYMHVLYHKACMCVGVCVITHACV